MPLSILDYMFTVKGETRVRMSTVGTGLSEHVPPRCHPAVVLHPHHPLTRRRPRPAARCLLAPLVAAAAGAAAVAATPPACVLAGAAIGVSAAAGAADCFGGLRGANGPGWLRGGGLEGRPVPARWGGGVGWGWGEKGKTRGRVSWCAQLLCWFASGPRCCRWAVFGPRSPPVMMVCRAWPARHPPTVDIRPIREFGSQGTRAVGAFRCGCTGQIAHGAAHGALEGAAHGAALHPMPRRTIHRHGQEEQVKTCSHFSDAPNAARGICGYWRGAWISLRWRCRRSQQHQRT